MFYRKIIFLNGRIAASDDKGMAPFLRKLFQRSDVVVERPDE
jgi:hypothetical protein